ncbi:MAG: tyrosine--tRNA ligase [Oceanospirillaceae bacterium]|mgnify:FL=1|jgi:tyrosyl-tRNA synthetase|nr:tyrosine--tRNA ligase [Oceanospirillaceae bacterium]MBT4441704.1 tyrosine--tRNA ligase [Oceanospirillaceae bacterium]MBT6077609.1 tyrosine--tRNA ligase [Oceanospirillaceae bacterium]
MTAVDTNLLADLQMRGLVNQMTSPEDLAEHLQQSRVLYCGFDPTADSLHIGSLVPLLVLRRFQQAGHKPLALVGGATGMIGDPSFKAQERKLNTVDIINQWVGRLKAQVSAFIEFNDQPNSAEVVNNYDWTKDVDVLTFLRDVGKHFSVSAMIQKESVKQRLDRDGEGISFTEFAYMILQSFDFSELYKQYHCSLQIGGSDQWGNITGGIDLTRRQHRAQVFGLTLPLVTKSDGTKFGKTESGTIWLDAKKTSQYAFYQFWINSADADVYQFLRYFTFLSEAQMVAIEEQDKAAQGRPQAQAILASEVTRLVHGEEGLQAALRITEALFSGQLIQLASDDLQQLYLDGMPASATSESELSLVQMLVESGLAKSNKMAREFIGNNAVSINGEKVSDVDAVFNSTSGLHKEFHVIKRGKKLFHLLRWQA